MPCPAPGGGGRPSQWTAMLVESDVLYAYVKKSDWLKPVAVKIVEMAVEGALGTLYASREVLHELYYLSVEEGVPPDEYLARAAALTAIDNLVFLPTTPEIDLLAFTLLAQYRLGSVFDAYHAATALSQVPDHTIVSTDHVYDSIPGIRRIDPRSLVGSK